MKSAQAKLEQIDLTLIDDHPDNPRLYDRQEVIDGIAASLRETGEFAQKHAVHVRPLAGKRFQLLAGHHRKKAAIKAGVKKVWAWIEDVDDREALMALVLANRQGELSPLEIGLHVLKAVPTEEGGRR
jgi:ParB family transcriptional regulator, chromosome partitioning protein